MSVSDANPTTSLLRITTNFRMSVKSFAFLCIIDEKL
jgi:hypothetical protein